MNTVSAFPLNDGPRKPRLYSTLRDANAARQEEWDVNNQIDTDWRMNELAGETGECCNVLKKLHRERLGLVGSRVTKDDLADELADVVICLDLTLMAGSYDPAKAINTRGVAITSLARAGHMLFSHVARLFTVLAFNDPREIGPAADRVFSFVALIAAAEGIDLDIAVEKKFNETTRKVGLTSFYGLGLD
jgi:NTP pyrophosphatase (non-canonical NTP hydrolase)